MKLSLVSIAVGVCIVISAGLAVVASVGPTPYPPVRLVRVNGVNMYAPARLADVPLATSLTKQHADGHATPRVEVFKQEFSFGVVEPLRTHRHIFEIRNVGTAPLQLAKHGTSCKCLYVEVIDRSVAPGSVGRVAVVWDAKPIQTVFLQRATIKTNDPERELIDLTIQGQTRLIVAAEPAILAPPPIKPNQRVTTATRIVSQVWRDFTIDDVHSTLDGVQWKLSPIEPEFLEESRAKSGWKLTVTLPANLPSGLLQESLRFTARPASVQDRSETDVEILFEPLEREVPIEARVKRRVALYGKGITPAGVFQLGNIDQRAGYEGRFLLKVNDSDTQLTITEVAVNPSFVDIELNPHPLVKKPGAYELRLRIPPSSPAGIYQGESQGTLSLAFDHVRIPSLELGLKFLIVPSERPGAGRMVLTHQPAK